MKKHKKTIFIKFIPEKLKHADTACNNQSIGYRRENER
jgi:hypothetical protein